jgi:predicted PurR-regulated permease PerM
MDGHARHRQGMERLEKKSAKTPNEHGCIAVNPNYGAVVGEPARAGCISHGRGFGGGIGTGNSLTNVLGQRRAQRLELLVHVDVRHRLIFSAYASVMSSPDGENPVDSDQRSTLNRAVGNTRWLIRAAAVFWAGYLVMVATRHTFHRLTDLLILLVVSLFLAFAIEPGVNKLEARGWRRGRATISIVLSVVVGAIALMTLFATLVANQLVDVAQNSEKYVNETVDFINDTFNANIDPKEVNDEIADPNGAVQKFIDRQQDKVVSVSVAALGALLQAFSVLLFTYYLVADGPRLRRALCSRLSPDRQVSVLNGWEIAVSKTGGYLYSRALLALISSFFHWIAFQAIGTPAPIAMAIWVGIVSQFLPVVGTYVAGVLPLVLSFVNRPASALFVIGFIVIYQQLENYLFSPRITARTMDLHPALAFGAAIAGAAVLGPVGALLALPAAAMFQAIGSEWGQRHEVIVSPLTNVQEKQQRKRRSSKKKT